MNRQINPCCTMCGQDIPPPQRQQDIDRCPKCGYINKTTEDAVNHSRKSGRMSQRQLILMMVLLPLLVVAMTVGSWYLIKAYRLPSADFGKNQVQANLIDSNDIYTTKHALSHLIFIRK